MQGQILSTLPSRCSERTGGGGRGIHLNPFFLDTYLTFPNVVIALTAVIVL